MQNIPIKPITGYPGYYAGEDGNIYSEHRLSKSSTTLRRLKPGIQSTGRYFIVNLKNESGKFKSCRIHSLICKTFYGNPKSNQVCSHEDGNWKNNKPSNLKWKTQKQNHQLKKDHGTDDKGCKNSRALINEKQLLEIRKLLKKAKLTHKEIGNKFGVSRVFITKIKNNYRYGNKKQDVFCFDIDGTLADHNGHRGPFDEHKVHLDEPIAPVWKVLKSLRKDYKIIFVSGRTDGCFSATHEWLDKHLRENEEGPIAIHLYMRRSGDFRKDSIIKKEIYENHILPNHNIIGVFDDRLQVCRWLYDEGIFCFNVNQGLKEF